MITPVLSGVRDRVYAIDQIATLPQTLVRILEVVQDEHSSALDLANEIAADQALAMQILRTVNSSYYGLRRRVQTISESVVILGFEEVERVALSVSVVNFFGTDPHSLRLLNTLWRHSVACSIIAGSLERRYLDSQPGLSGARVAGLLHDIGKAVIAQHFPEAVGPIRKLMEEQDMSSVDAEKAVLDGYSHCDIGSWVAETWGLPETLVESIALHHMPHLVPADHGLVHLAHLADQIATLLGYPSVKLDSEKRTAKITCDILGIDDSMIAKLAERLEQQKGAIGMLACAGHMPASGT
ncbi:MAG: hypothetical protein AMXMBFR84_00200 [Candidatus Hydrogenedentota bacterium]